MVRTTVSVLLMLKFDFIHVFIFLQVKFPKKNFITQKSQFDKLEKMLPPRPTCDDNITDEVDEVINIQRHMHACTILYCSKQHIIQYSHWLATTVGRCITIDLTGS